MSRQLELLGRISELLLGEQEISESLSGVLKLMANDLCIQRGMITIMNRRSGAIFLKQAYGFSASEQAKGVYAPGEGIVGEVVASGQPIVVPDVGSEPRFLNRTGARRKHDHLRVSFICVPIKAGLEVIGSLSMDRPIVAAEVLEEEVRLLTIIAAMLAQLVRRYQKIEEERSLMRDENLRLQESLRERFTSAHIIGRSKVMQRTFALIEKVAPTNATVLILGESGVGKEVVARAVHFGSQRAGKPFVKLNCAALPETIIESELFGHERGAFSGALAQRKGRFELAHCGTIFLDEIGELSLNTQAKLLRVLQEKEFERVGGQVTLKSDVRVLAATNRDLEQKVREGLFREDLYYRLNVIALSVPPLRERKTDIPLLADHFTDKYARENAKRIARISTPAIECLMAYHWPGNVRELENCIERAVILSDDGAIHSYHLPPSLQLADAPPTGLNLEQQVERLERELMMEALKQARGNVAAAAESLGLTYRSFGLRARKYQINFMDYRSPKVTD